MKVVKVKHLKDTHGKRVHDCSVGNGYWKAAHGSLPDVDIDFQADRRPEVKAYLEERYNKNHSQRVFSAGTFTTIKIKTAIKDICRVHRVSVATANYITAIIDDDGMSWTDFMRLAAKDKRVKDFVEKHPDVFEEILPLMEQTRSAGIHASAIIITPEYVKGKKVDCFDLLPIRRMNGLLVSEISGYDVDAIGILKNDVLGIQELTRLADMFKLIKEQYGKSYTMLDIIVNHSEPKDVNPIMQMLSSGQTQGVFQMSGQGITRFIREMQPAQISDLIALVALFRPGPLDTGAAKKYVEVKNHVYPATYFWGTEETLKKTYGQIVYQEQIAEIARNVGGLSLGDGVNLVKAISKKKIEKVNKFKSKFFTGAKNNGCPDIDAEAIWNTAENFAKYAFNASHATAYGLTAYVGAWLKSNYPMVFYSVILRDISDDKLPSVISEINASGRIKLVQPDINVSGTNFMPIYDDNKIYWSLSRIKWVGDSAVRYIMKERELYGEFSSLEDFIGRIFRIGKKDTDKETTKNPVNSRAVKNIVLSGAFDKCEHLEDVCLRYDLLKKAFKMMGKEKEFDEDMFPEAKRSDPMFWAKLQMNLSGFSDIDYEKLWTKLSCVMPTNDCPFINFNVLDDKALTMAKGYCCGTIKEVTEKSYTSGYDGSRKHFGKLILKQNADEAELTIWGATWDENKSSILRHEGAVIAATVSIEWSEYSHRYTLKLANSRSFIKIID
jgi:DNA polymerase-3 subunit alpha